MTESSGISVCVADYTKWAFGGRDSSGHYWTPPGMCALVCDHL